MTLLERQRAANLSSQHCWAQYAEHRDQVTDLLLRAAKKLDRSELRLAVLGAGNLNDLDLSALHPTISACDCFDIDIDSVNAGIERQSSEHSRTIPTVQVMPPCDLSGIADHLARIANGKSPSEIEGGMRDLLRYTASNTGLASSERSRTDYDLVLSAGLLSQIIHQVRDAFPNADAVCEAVCAEAMLRHFRIATDMLSDDGRFVLVTEHGRYEDSSCSSLTDSTLLSATGPSNVIASLSQMRLQQAAHQAGLDASSLCLEDVRWIWKVGHRRYVCSGYSMARASSSGTLDSEAQLQSRLTEFQRRTGISAWHAG